MLEAEERPPRPAKFDRSLRPPAPAQKAAEIDAMHQTVVRQMLHYLARPHDGLPRGTLEGPAAWRGDTLEEPRWREELSDADRDELEAAIVASEQSCPSLQNLDAAHFPLPFFGARIARWREALTAGPGLRLIGGFPVERWGPERSARCFWGLGQHLGLPGAQDPQGTLLGHVRDRGLPDDSGRAYRTNQEIHFHCDGADVVGLMCLAPSARGGLSRVVSSITVFNALYATAPSLAARLFEPFWLDSRGDSWVQGAPVRPCRHFRGTLRTFYHTDYFRSASRHPGIPDLSAKDRATLDAYDEIANSPGIYLDMPLRAGDVQLIHNHTLLHARTAYSDASEDRRRHLLRLWLSLDRPVDLHERMAIARSYMGTLGGLVRQGLRERLKLPA